MWKASKIKVTGIFIDNSTDSLREHTLAVPSFYQFLNTKLSIHCCSTIPPGNTELPFQPGPRHVSAPCCTGRKTHSTYRRDFHPPKERRQKHSPYCINNMNHFPSINAISASICLLGCGLALPVFSQQPEKENPMPPTFPKQKLTGGARGTPC